MTVVGLINAYREAGNIGPAVTSLLEGGCDKVIVVDGPWRNQDGTTFGRGPLVSDDGTIEEAQAAGAKTIVPCRAFPSDGAKRHWAIKTLHVGGDADEGDHLLLLDADERLVGTIGREADQPSGHGCVLLRNLKPNDMPDVRGTFPSGDWSPEGTIVPLLRWLRYSPHLECNAPGSYYEDGRRIEPYLVNALRARLDTINDRVVSHAYAALRDVEQHLTVNHATVLPILHGVEIHHVAEATAERVQAKRTYYLGTEAAAA